MKRVMISALALMLAACTAQNSVDRNATHAAHQLAAVHFDPNTRLQLANTIRLMRPGFEAAWREGAKDRAAGLTPAEMEARVASVYSPENFPDTALMYRFLDRKYLAEQPEKKRKILTDALKTAWRDGYEGRP